MGVQLSESGETGDVIKGAGFLQYGQVCYGLKPLAVC